MARMKIVFECDWQPRKLATVQAGIQRMFAQLGGVSNLSEVKIVLEDETKEEKKPAEKLRLVCRQYDMKTKEVCNERWESQFMTPCPKCKGRAFVRKLEPEGDPEQNPKPPQTAATTTESTVPASS